MVNHQISLRRDRHNTRSWEVSFKAPGVPGCIIDLRILNGCPIMDITNVDGMGVRVDAAHLAGPVRVGLDLLKAIAAFGDEKRERLAGRTYNVEGEYLGESMDPVGLAHAMILGQEKHLIIMEEGEDPEERPIYDITRVDLEYCAPFHQWSASNPRMVRVGMALVEELVHHLDLRHMSALLYEGDVLLGESFNPLLAASWLLDEMRVVELYVVGEGGEGEPQNVDIRGVTRTVLRQR